jgi:hypothetical protein
MQVAVSLPLTAIPIKSFDIKSFPIKSFPIKSFPIEPFYFLSSSLLFFCAVAQLVNFPAMSQLSITHPPKSYLKNQSWSWY